MSSSSEPSYADLDIETLHKQLLEAAAAIDPPTQSQYSYIDPYGLNSRTFVVNPTEQARPDRRRAPLAENSGSVHWPQIDHFRFKVNAAAAMRVDCPSSPMLGRVPPVHDRDFAFVRPQAVEYRPAIPADYTTAIPCVFSREHDEPHGRSGAVVSRAARGSPRRSSTRRAAPLPRNATSSPRHSSARNVGESVCPVQACGKIYKRVGDLNRHLQSRAHQLPDLYCPSGCGRMFSHKDAAKRHSESDECPMF